MFSRIAGVIAWFFLLEACMSAQNLVWEDQFDLSGGPDHAVAVIAHGGKVAAVGVGTTAGSTDLLVRAYEASDGTLLWQGQKPLSAGVSAAVTTDAASNMAFAAGYVTTGTDTDFVVQAYNTQTGAKLWEDIVDKGRDDFPQAIAAGPQGVYVVGYGGNVADGPIDFLVRAYDKQTGTVLWEDQVDRGGPDAAWRVAVEGNMVYVAGSTAATVTDPWNLIVRAYDANTGVLDWEASRPLVQPFAGAIGTNQIFVAGSGFLSAYAKQTGVQNWTTQTGTIVDIATDGAIVYTAGDAAAAYDSAGNVLWQATPAAGESFRALEVCDGKVFLAGSRQQFEPTQQEFLVKILDALTGAVLWSDLSHASFSSEAMDVTVSDGFYVAGWATNAVGNEDFLVRAYSLPKTSRIRKAIHEFQKVRSGRR